MNKPLSDQDLDAPLPDLTEQALQWLVDLHAGEGCSASWDDYLRWCGISPGHQQAAQTAERLWERLGSAVERPKTRRLPLLGLGLALLLGGGLAWQAQDQGWMADQRTAVGERRQVRLADGSQLELGPQTRLDVRFEQGRRTLHLYAGEVFVQVAADPQRPFEVEARGGRMQALGTAFDVRHTDDAVQMVVTEHAVRVSLDDTGQTAEVHEGQGVQYGSRWLSRPYAVDVNAAMAWRRGRLVFNAKPLGEVVEELGRYHQSLILIRDADLRELPVTGIVGTGDTAAQLQLLERSLPVRIRQLPWLTLIERDPARAGTSKK